MYPSDWTERKTPNAILVDQGYTNLDQRYIMISLAGFWTNL